MTPEVITTKERTGNIETTLTRVVKPEDEFIAGMVRPYRYAADIQHNITEDERAAYWFELEAQMQMFKDETNF